jgi:type II secretory pathway pseudopilin PulG
LVELLVVLTIMTLLFAVAVPLMRPAFEDRNLREATRQINAIIAGARARAAQSGRPAGIWLERLDASPLGSRSCIQIFQAEVAPSFAGATTNTSLAYIDTALGKLVFTNAADAQVLRTIVQPGEVFTIKFDYKGITYTCARPVDPLDSTFDVSLPPLGAPPGADSSPGRPYQITRAPVRSIVTPLALPGDTVVDLSMSGAGTDGRQFDPYNGSMAPILPADAPVMVTFNPSGGIDYVYVGNASFRPFGPVHLLIGRIQNVVDPLDPATDFTNQTVPKNLTDPSCLWLTINHRTGSVTTTENVDTQSLPAATTLPLRIKAAREFARDAIRKGGR